jgi:hypothetical protein
LLKNSEEIVFLQGMFNELSFSNKKKVRNFVRKNKFKYSLLDLNEFFEKLNDFK